MRSVVLQIRHIALQILAMAPTHSVRQVLVARHGTSQQWEAHRAGRVQVSEVVHRLHVLLSDRTHLSMLSVEVRIKTMDLQILHMAQTLSVLRVRGVPHGHIRQQEATRTGHVMVRMDEQMRRVRRLVTQDYRQMDSVVQLRKTIPQTIRAMAQILSVL